MLPRRSALVVCQVIRRQYSESERTKFDWKKISFDLMREIINEKEKNIIHWQSQVSQQNGIDGQLSTVGHLYNLFSLDHTERMNWKKTSLELMREIINEKDKNIHDKERLIKSQQNAFDGQLSAVGHLMTYFPILTIIMIRFDRSWKPWKMSCCVCAATSTFGELSVRFLYHYYYLSQLFSNRILTRRFQYSKATQIDFETRDSGIFNPRPLIWEVLGRCSTPVSIGKSGC